jgi:hypothetical protein
VIITILIIAVAGFFLAGRFDSSVLLPISSAVMAQPVGDLPSLPEKPAPAWMIFNGCPPWGKGGDRDLNLMKNRIDKGNYVPVSFDSITALTWPKTAERQPMSDWSALNKAFIGQYAGIPVSVEGYLVNFRESSSEAANCNRTGDINLIWSMNFAQTPKARRQETIIVESTPPARLGHTWTVDQILSLIVDPRYPVRISGWLYFDPDHPQDVGRTRATLWEISPVMQIEVFQDGRWNPLDKYGK